MTPHTTYDPTRPVGTVTFENAPAEQLDAPYLHPGLEFATSALCAEMIGTAQRPVLGVFLRLVVGLCLALLLGELNREEGVALVFVTHAADLAARAGRVVELRDGRLAPK